jgi:hypothetical protein
MVPHKLFDLEDLVSGCSMLEESNGGRWSRIPSLCSIHVALGDLRSRHSTCLHRFAVTIPPNILIAQR